MRLYADGIGTNDLMRPTGKSKTRIWQEPVMQEGFDGFLRDKACPAWVPPLGEDVTERIVALTLQVQPSEATHWSGAMIGKAVGDYVRAARPGFSRIARRWFATLIVLDGTVIGPNV